MADVFRFRLRGGPAAEWTLINPTLAEREPGVETDTGALKIGDGVHAWADLPYSGQNMDDILQAISDQITPFDDRLAALESLPPGSYDDTQLRLDIDTKDSNVLRSAKEYADTKGVTLGIGTVEVGQAAVSISGTAPNQLINFVVPQGPQGLRGERGEQGEQGLQGERGPIGLTGEQGPANTLTIGSVTVGDAASASITGTAPNQVLNLTIVPGPKGDQGLQGERGPIGLTGDTGQAGQDGTDGRGIVSVADTDADGVATVTYSDGVTAPLPLPRGLKGDQGEQGEQGLQGERGLQGVPGRGVSSIADPDNDGIATITYSDGANAALPLPEGPKGDKGDIGQTGQNGADGRGITSVTDDDADGIATVTFTDGANSPLPLPRGLRGEQGFPGDKGDKGDKGDTGRGVTSILDPDLDGTATVTYTDGGTGSLPLPKGPKGDKGEAGQGITITGSVPTTANLDDGTVDKATLTAGDAYLVDDTGLLHIWDGTAFGSGVAFKGDQGEKGEQGDRGPIGPDGAAATITVGSTVTVPNGTPASVSNEGTTAAAIFSFEIPAGPKGDKGDKGDQGSTGQTGRGVSSITDTNNDGIAVVAYTDGTSGDLPLPQGQKGDKGDTGQTGQNGTAATVTAGTTSTVPNGTPAAVENVGTTTAAIFDFTIPTGPKGDKGDKGDVGQTGQTGQTGQAATITAGTATSVANGTAPTVTNRGTTSAAIFDFEIPTGPKGDKGDQGNAGTAATVSAGTTATGLPGSAANVENAGTSSARVLNFTIPAGAKGDKGDKGDQGNAGTAATVSAGTTATGLPGSAAQVENAGTSSARVLNFTIPAGAKGDKGDKGDQGNAGTAATVTVGSTATVANGTPAAVENTGTTSAAILNFTIPSGPKGDKGDQGAEGPPAAVTIAPKPASALPSTYPTGISITETGSTTGWPTQYGAIETVRYGTNRSWQTFVDRTSGTSWRRTPDAGDAAWLPWIEWGAKGDAGDNGADGSDGTPATVAIGTVSTVANGTPADVDNVGTASAAVLDFKIPAGPKGDKGDTGQTGQNGTAATIAVGTVGTVANGSPATVNNSGSTSAAIFDFQIPAGPKGDKGDKGDAGTAASVSVGTTATGLPGSAAAVEGTGTSAARVLNFTIPQGAKGDKGDKGDQGNAGTAASVSVGTTATGLPGSAAQVESAGTSTARVLNFTIPAGAKGDKGDKGDTGQTGQNGSAATVTVGTTATGLPGSAAAVENAGSTSAAILNFTIPQGAKGDKGDKGDTGSPGTTSWNGITDKPNTFAPSAHTHLPTEISGTGTIPASAVPLATSTTQGGVSAANFNRINNAVSTATASRVVIRDSASRAQFADPAALQDAATKNYVDTGLNGKAGTSHTHSYTTLTNIPTEFTPAAHTHTDATTTTAGFMPAADKTKLDGAVSTATASRLVARDAAGRAQYADPAVAADAANKGYVDTRAVPTGGTTGQVLSKTSATNYATQWIDPPATGGGTTINTPFLVRYQDGAWEYTTLAAAQAAGLIDGQTAWFAGPFGVSTPAWARTGDIWMEA